MKSFFLKLPAREAYEDGYYSVPAKAPLNQRQ